MGRRFTGTQVQKLEYEDVKDSPADGIYVHGLYLEGCSWSKKEAHMIEAARGELVSLSGTDSKFFGSDVQQRDAWQTVDVSVQVGAWQ